MKPFYFARLIFPIAVLLGLNCTADAQTTFSIAGGPYTYTVPAGVTTLGVDLAGAQGGSYSGATGGAGGRVTCNLTVVPGTVLYVYVGGNSSSYTGGTNGGGSVSCCAGAGGGASDIRTTGGGYTTGLSSRLVVGGGGGGGASICYTNPGGTGGYPSGGNGGVDGCFGSCYSGSGASITSGGGGAPCGCSNSGTLGVGGNNNCGEGGGGGGGYYGGGAGFYGGGGGGSSWAGSTASNISYLNGTQTGNGYVIIYGPTLTTTVTSLNFGAVTAGTTSVPAQYFAMNGTYMGASPLTITAPANYLVSTDGITWSSSLTYSYTPPNISSASGASNIYVKFAAPTTAGSYCGNISITGGGLASPVLVNVCGNSATACAGSVPGGSSVISPTTGSSATLFTLSIPSAPSSGGLTYQWQSSPTGTGSWTNIPGAVTASYSFTGITATTYYRAIVTCTATGSTGTYSGASASLQTTPTYCTPTSNFLACSYGSVGTSAYPFQILNSSSTAILSDPSNCGFQKYWDQTATSYTCTMTQGQPYSFKVGANTSGLPNSWQVWIDFNNDGTFSSTESLGGALNWTSLQNTQSITIPNVPSGIYRMRIVGTYSGGFAAGSNANYPGYPQEPSCPTTTVNYAETRDYNVTIGPGACSGTPPAGIADVSQTVGCNGFTTNLFDVGVPAMSGLSYQWMQSPTPGSGYFASPGASAAPAYTATVTTVGNTYYICRITCANGGGTSQTNPITITENPPPAPISGATTVCNGQTVSLVSSPSTGVWTSSTPSVATVGSVSGTVTGVAVGSTTITYTLPSTGCYATTTESVITAPSPISGTAVTCQGTSTTLSNLAPGGIWSSSTPSVVSIGSSSGIATGVSVGGIVTYGTVNYMLSNGCQTSTTVTVNPNPTLALVSVTGSSSYCAGNPSTADIRLGSSTPGIQYALQLGGFTVSTLPGTGGLLDFGVQTATGTYTVFATNPITTCTRTMAGNVTVTVNPSPIAFPVSVTGGGVYCAGDVTHAPDVILMGSQTGINYQLYLGGTTAVGAPIPGSGLPISFGPQTLPGVYTVVGTSSAGCSTPMTGSGIVIVNPLPTPYIVTGGGTYCVGGSGIDISLSYSNTGVSYQLLNGGSAIGGPVAGTGTVLDFGLQTMVGTYSIVATNNSTGCANNMTGTPGVYIATPPNAYAVTGGGAYCSGGSGVVVGVNPTDPGVSYQLFLGTTPVGAPVTGSGLGLSFGSQTTPGTYTVVATDPISLCSNNMTGSAVVSINPLPAIYSVTGGGNYCSGGTGVPVGLPNSQPGVTYTLSPGGTTLVGTGGALSFGLQTTSGTYTISATNNTTHCTANMTGSATVGINPLPTQFNVTGTGAYCAGGTGLAVGLDFSESGVSYQLLRGTTPIGSAVPGTGAPLNFGPQTVAGTYTVTGVNTGTSCADGMTGSAVISINPVPTTHLVTGGGSFCSGGAGIDVGVNGSNSGINYQLYLGTSPIGSPIAGTGSPIDFGLQTVGGTYAVLGIDATTGCMKNMTGGANVVVNALPAPYAVTGGGVFCEGGLGAHVGLSGSSSGIRYQLSLGGTPVGSAINGTGSPIDFGMESGAGSYTVLATSATSGCTNNMTGSAIVGINPAPVVYAVTGGGSYCIGGAGVDVGLGNSDFNVNYQLMRGTTAIGGVMAGTGAALDFGMQTTAGTYTVVATDAITGCMKNMTASALVGINALPAVYTVSGGGSYCSGGTGVHVLQSLSATGVSYQLMMGGAPVGTAMAGTGAGLDFGLQTTAGTYTVVATNSTTSCTNNMSGSASISVNPLPASYDVTGGGGYCPGGTGVTIGLDGSDAGVRYQLYNGLTGSGTPVNGSGASITFGLRTGTGTYSVVATNAATGCSSTMTGSAAVTVTPPPTVYAVTGGGTYCASGMGVNVGISSSDVGVNYQLYLGSTPSGVALPGTGGAIDFGRKTGAGTYTAVATDATTGCTSNMGGGAIIGINPVVLPHVTVASSIAGTVCTGQNVIFTASPINGGSSPTFQWMVNGVSASVGNTFSYVPLNGDVVTAIIHSNAVCAIPDTGSTSITMNVSPMEMPSVTLDINPGTLVCTGSPVTFTANPMFGGTAPQLVWIKNGVQVATGSSYTYTPTNHDIVTFLLGSNFNCRLADSVFSTPATMDVENPVIPTVAVTSSTGVNVTPHQAVTFTATVTHGGPAVSYQWVVNSSVIPGATGATYTTSNLADHDSISCQVTGVCGLVGFNEVVVRVITTGVGVISTSGSDIRMVPNPNKGEFTVKGSLGSAVDQEVSIEVTDMLGQTVYSGKAMTHGGNIDEHVKLNGTLANGMYLLNLRSGSDHTVIHFVVEQ